MDEDNISYKSVKVVVLGDIGRSPRMQYHSLSLATNGFKVNIIGYVDSQPLTEVCCHPNIVITKLKPLVFNKGPKIFQYALKAFWQAISLLMTLFLTGHSDYLLCQNPPAVPTLPICRCYCLLTKTNFVIDWHNYAYTIMGLSLPPGHFLLNLSKNIEKFFGQSSNGNICVTYAMKNDLLENWNIVATVLHDRPPVMFHPITIEEKHSWFTKISENYPEFSNSFQDTMNEQVNEPLNASAFTELIANVVTFKKDRPGLLFSSTSWTADEDFGILMEALQAYETAYELTNKLPKLLCVITGKGPMKQHYIDQIALRNWNHVKVVTPWLEACDYPTMVASADLGVCLHTSSSGLDLPMKVVDMFGAGLPVLACDFKCLHELVEDGINGYTFKNSDELSKQIVSWFEDFPNNETQNVKADGMRKKLVKFQESQWEDNWNLRAKKFFS